MSDVLQSNGIVSTEDFESSPQQVVELFVANPDMTYAAHVRRQFKPPPVHFSILILACLSFTSLDILRGRLCSV